MGWVKEHWGIITSVASAVVLSLGLAYKAVAWQFNQDAAIQNDRQRIETMEEAVKRQTEQRAIVVDVQKAQAAQDAKIDMMIDLMKEMNRKME